MLTVTTKESLPYVGLRGNGVGDLQIVKGKFGEIFLELSHLLNFSYTLTLPSDGAWGAKMDDGTWSGMVGQLETRQVDLGKKK